MTVDILGKLLALGSALTWAFAVIYFKRSGDTMKPVALNLYKTTIAAILFLPLFWIFNIPFFPENAPGKDYILLILSGVLGIALADSLFFWSLNILGAGLSAIVDCLYSPMVIALSFIFLSEFVSSKEIIGACLILSAILLGTLKIDQKSLIPKRFLLGILIGAFSMFWIAFGVILMKPALGYGTALWVIELRLIAGAISLWIQVLFLKSRGDIFRSISDVKTLKDAFPATFLGNFLAMGMWIFAFKYTSINSAAILNQTSTIFIVILATLLLKEPFTRKRGIAVFLAFAGSLIVII